MKVRSAGASSDRRCDRQTRGPGRPRPRSSPPRRGRGRSSGMIVLCSVFANARHYGSGPSSAIITCSSRRDVIRTTKARPRSWNKAWDHSTISAWSVLRCSSARQRASVFRSLETLTNDRHAAIAAAAAAIVATDWLTRAARSAPVIDACELISVESIPPGRTRWRGCRASYLRRC
jgi:hypothetical protein